MNSLLRFLEKATCRTLSRRRNAIDAFGTNLSGTDSSFFYAAAPITSYSKSYALVIVLLKPYFRGLLICSGAGRFSQGRRGLFPRN